MLRDYIGRFAPGRVLCIDETREITAGDLMRTSSAPQLLREKKIALCVSDPMIFAPAFVLLDSLASCVLLVPGGNSLPAEIMETFQPDLLLTDDVAQSLLPAASRLPKDPQAGVSTHRATSWVIPTSGTTASPKLVSHTLNSLTRTAKTDAGTGRHYRWGQLYDMARFAGIQVFLNSLLSGSTLIFTSPADLRERVEKLVRNDCNAISATPTLWRKILMTPAASQLPLRQITLGGEIADQNILSALRAQYPAARISHIYASTEAGAAFTVNDGKAGFPSQFLTSPPPGIQLRIDRHGYLLIRPDRCEQSYFSDSGKIADVDGFINTGDLVEQRNDRIHFLGRANGAINVGGNKVQPEEVEAVLHSLPGVRLAKVYAKASSITGSLVAADIQMDAAATDRSIVRKQITAHCARSLADFKIPAIIRFVDEIHTKESGKIARQ
jgi:acyl-CoA synthetase (AMP-forming)/AMP-acid ligase II